MNSQQLKDLAEQAGLSYMPSNSPDMADLYKGADFELEKFVELIVKECSNFLKDTLDDHFAAEQLVEHFGVKE